MNENRFMTVSEVAVAMSVTPATVYVWINDGSVKAKDCRREGSKNPKYRISAKEVERISKLKESGLPV